MQNKLAALIGAGLLSAGLVTSANAADLGGNCCADLEERIAELEATTARKGNRKVSLTVSGWVGQQVTFWDDGVESNTYVHDLGSTLGSHVKFTGSAQISTGWSAGYVLHIEAISSDSLTMNADRPVGPGALAGGGNVQTLQSYWFVKSDHLGKVGVGKQSQASDNTAILVDGSGSLVAANWVAFDVNSFAIRGRNVVNLLARGDEGGDIDVFAGKTWGSIGGCYGGGAWGDCNGATQNVVRYDSPTFGGFSVSASWGEDDMWDVAARYAGEHHGFKFAAAAAYNEITGGGVNNTYAGGQGNLIPQPEVEYFQVGAYLQHVPTGLFVYGAYGHNKLNGAGVGLDVEEEAYDFTGVEDGEFDIHSSNYEADTFYVKGGLRSKWNHLGATVLYGEYLNVQGDTKLGGEFEEAEAGTITQSDNLDVWGLGIVQEVDAAAMSVWVKYRQLSLDSTTSADSGEEAGSAKADAEDFHYVGVGGMINF